MKQFNQTNVTLEEKKETLKKFAESYIKLLGTECGISKEEVDKDYAKVMALFHDIDCESIDYYVAAVDHYVNNPTED